MGVLQKRQMDFEEHCKTAYSEIMKILEDKYCWKCPMRSTSTQSRCRELHSGRLLQEALEEGIISQLVETGVVSVELEALMNRMLKKRIKHQGGNQREKTIILKVEAWQNTDLAPDSWIKVKVNPKRVRVGDEILIPDEQSDHPLVGTCALVAGFPFQTARVQKTYHEGNFWYVETDNERILPLESVFGVLIKVFEEG
ncbi:hypothetical protein [Methanobacterium petrolearium]|uniref:hypothetical protein n=1 Tax=Methanobacterium petrolearium TaxID=710190 RepID=UPI001AE471B7|nr:hypothetical protein [Methanobacterium petrolearium]MBP1944809.1 hypothetical protein [Methanobacterium petrolearium]